MIIATIYFHQDSCNNQWKTNLKQENMGKDTREFWSIWLHAWFAAKKKARRNKVKVSHEGSYLVHIWLGETGRTKKQGYVLYLLLDQRNKMQNPRRCKKKWNSSFNFLFGHT